MSTRQGAGPAVRQGSAPTPGGAVKASHNQEKSVEEIINHFSKCRHMTGTQVTSHNRESSADRAEACGLIYTKNWSES